MKCSVLVEPLREAGRIACAHSGCDFVLLAHDWSKLDYAAHASKKDKRQLTHQRDIGYDLTTALLVDAKTGSPLSPMQMHLSTSEAVYSTSENRPAANAHHLEQLVPTMNEAAGWDLPRRIVHVIDREGDSLGYFRQCPSRRFGRLYSRDMDLADQRGPAGCRRF